MSLLLNLSRFERKEVHKLGFDIMGRGRKKGVKPPLTSAERQKRYRARQKEIDPEGYKQKKKNDNRTQYEKNKKNPIKKLQLQMDGITAYYRKNPLIKVINAKKSSNESWGVDLFLSIEKEYVTIEPSKSEICLLPVLKHKYTILWICSKTEKEAVKGPSGYLKTQEMLLGYQIRMVIAAAKPDKEILSSFQFNLARANKDIKWDIWLNYDENNNNVKFKKGKASDNLMWKCDVQKVAWNNLKEWYDIVALNVGKNMWYPDYGTIQDKEDVERMLKKNNEVIVYANPSSDNTECKNIPQVYDSAWQDIDQG